MVEEIFKVSADFSIHLGLSLFSEIKIVHFVDDGDEFDGVSFESVAFTEYLDDSDCLELV